MLWPSYHRGQHGVHIAVSHARRRVGEGDLRRLCTGRSQKAYECTTTRKSRVGTLIPVRVSSSEELALRASEQCSEETESFV